MNNTNTISQNELFNAELNSLRKDITPNDKKEAMKALGIKDRTTVANYLSMKGKNNDVAVKLILFFRNRINARNVALGLKH